MKLYARPGCFRAQKVLVAAQYAGVAVEVVPVSKSNESALKGKACCDRLPLLETPEGSLVEANAIMRFVASSKTALTGKSTFEAAQINSWCDFASNELDIQASVVTYPIIGWMENNPEVTARGLKDLKAALQVLEKHLKLETFLTGNAVTIADICVAAALVLPMKLVLDDATRKSLVCVTRWFTTVVNQKEFLKVVGPVTLIKKAVKASAPVAAAKAAAPAKEAKKEAAPAPAAPAKKAKHPLECLPKSSFVIDSWKRQYSNAPNGDYYSTMEWFWEKLDKEGYSVILSSYNYNDELKIAFQVSNLCTGFLQRCDEVRKYMFGVMNIIGEDSGPMEIVGAWVIRGKDAKAILDCNPDAEYHNWEVMTDFSEENKKKVADMWCSEDKVYGKPILDSKIFK